MDQDAASPISSGQQPPENSESQSSKPNNIVNDAEKRRERKRFTDRVAQRQHRKRQKLHIEELEAQLRALKSGGQSEVAQLTAHNARLYDELKHLYGLWDEMEDLLRRQRLLRGHSALRATCGSTSPHPDPHSSAFGEGVTTQNVMSELTADLIDRGATQPVGSNTQRSADPGFASMEVTRDSEEKDEPAIDLGDPGLAFSDNAVASDVYRSQWTPPDDPSGGIHQLCQTIPTPRSSSQLVPNGHTSRNQLQRSDEQRVDIDAEAFNTMDWAQIHQQLDSSLSHMPPHDDQTAYVGRWMPPPSPVSLSVPLAAMQQSQSLPMFLVPPLPKDKEVHAILDRARANISTIGPPSLSDFLFDDPKNTLSIDLKTLLAPVRQARRTSEFLAAYWVMYLLLRWQVIQDESAYQSVPSWLRPTQLQLTVPHPVAADLVPWPEIREELIHMSLFDQAGPYDVSFDIIRHMTVDIHTLDHAGLKDPTRLEAAILDLKNWNLGEGFFDRYPQWKCLKERNGGLQSRSRAMETTV
ncbi:hypothetical protein EDB81DRAFT_637426 [Dactylonectria macrodidyma]|uniref:BZIP domain-containing protein n=1 Tax=Dactylonectria macrodidyma TaxID=307937 RepID=A0A9P9FM52_9HYPO|nr:hypothetical protein EDB81DRAFT_637426 [Dactylonectria macrodidyma]